MDANNQKLAVSTELNCLECQRPWVEPTERWRMYATIEDEPEVGLYCPICASFEFDA